MMQYSVRIEAAGPPEAPPIDEEVLERFGTILTVYSGVVSGAIRPEHERTWSARLTVDRMDGDPVSAAHFAVYVVQVFARTTGMPKWPIVKVEVTEWERFCVELEQPNRPELVGVAELAELAGVTKQRASVLARRSGFPDPVASLAQGDVWDLRQVQEFLEGWTRKPGRPAREAPQGPPRDEPQGMTRMVFAKARAVVEPKFGLAVERDDQHLVIERDDQDVDQPDQPANKSKQDRPRRR